MFFWELFTNGLKANDCFHIALVENIFCKKSNSIEVFLGWVLWGRLNLDFSYHAFVSLVAIVIDADQVVWPTIGWSDSSWPYPRYHSINSYMSTIPCIFQKKKKKKAYAWGIVNGSSEPNRAFIRRRIKEHIHSSSKIGKFLLSKVSAIPQNNVNFFYLGQYLYKLT